jgi:hypothetical protein
MRKLYYHSVSMCNTLYKIICNYFQLISDKKKGLAAPSLNNLLKKVDGSFFVVQPENQKVTVA